MLVQGDITCLHCGFETGRWTGERGSTLTCAGLRTNDGQPAGAPDASIRCRRCKGPVLLTNATAAVTAYRLRRIQRMRDQLAEFEATARKRTRAA